MSAQSRQRAAPPSTETAPAPTVQVVDEDRKAPAFRVVGEAFKTYILVEIENNLYYIDKHAAHERMNFEALRRSAEIHSQLLLAPVTVRLNKAELSAVEEHLDLLQKGGFEVEIFGTDAVLVRSVPAMLGRGKYCRSDLRDRREAAGAQNGH